MLSTDSLERQLLDALPITIHAIDLDGRLTSVPQTASRFGDEPGAQSAPPAGALPGASIWDLTGAGFTREQVEHAMQRLRMGRARVVRWELSPAADDRRVLLAQMTPLHDDSRAVTGFVVSTTDVTSVTREREAATEASLALARATACGTRPCDIVRGERSPFAQTFEFRATPTAVTVRCTRAAVFVGEYGCEKR